MIKKLTCLAVVFYSMITMCAVEARAEKKIGILLFNEQPRYEENKKGVIDQLIKQGFGEPAVKLFVESAGGNKAKVVELARKFAAAKMDMVIPIGTSAAVAVTNEIKDIPIVFVMVWDPVESKIAHAWKSSGNNTTGSSSKTSASKLIRALKKFAAIKSVAVFYTPEERNTEIQLQEFKTVQNSFNITIVPVPLSNREMVKPVLSDVINRVDAICLTGSSVVGDSLREIVATATKARVITASQSEDHIINGGALLGITVDSYAVGSLAGEKAVKILKGSKPSSIPIESLQKIDLIFNMKTAQEGQFRIPPSFMKSVKKVLY